jgi:hypothetical protein
MAARAGFANNRTHKIAVNPSRPLDRARLSFCDGRHCQWPHLDCLPRIPSSLFIRPPIPVSVSGRAFAAAGRTDRLAFARVAMLQAPDCSPKGMP